MNIQNPPRSGGNGAEPRGRKPRRTPKGRQVDPQAVDEVAALLGDRSRRRDLLIEHLHLIQDKYGHISAAHLAALAAEMKLAQTEVYEVATFYAHFDVVKEGETPPPPVTVRVCDSLSCAMAGAEQLLDGFAEHARAERARRARALHGRLRSRAGLRRRPCAGDQRDAGQRRRRQSPMPTTHAHALQARHRLRALHGGRRLSRCSARPSPASARATS